MQVAHRHRVHGRAGEVELGQRLHHREAGVAHAVGRGPAFHVGQLQGQELAHDLFGRLVPLGRLGDHLVVGGAHAAQFELDYQLEDGGPVHHAGTIVRSPS